MTPAQALTRVRTRPHGLKQFSNYEVVASPDGAFVLVELTKGQWCEVGVDDWFSGLDKYKWCAMWNRYTRSFYAYGRIEGGKGKCEMMHRLILGLSEASQKGDHRNHDTLCNLRSNLRICSQSQNGMNRKQPPRNNKSGYMGVCLDKRSGRWKAEIRVCGKGKYLGSYTDPVEAATKRDDAARQFHGEFAYLNFPTRACA